MDDQAATEKLARHRGPPEPPRIAGWIYWTAGAGIILGGAAVALASWLAPSPEVPDGTDPPRRSVSQSAAIRTLPPLNGPTTLPVADETTPQSTLSAPSRPVQARTATRTPIRTSSPTQGDSAAPPAGLDPTAVDEDPIPPDAPASPIEESPVLHPEDPSPTPTDPTPSVIGDLLDDVAGEGT